MALPEMRHLQAAIALAEELNFSRAAARLRIELLRYLTRTASMQSIIS